MSSDENAAETPKRKNLNVDERRAVVDELLVRINKGKLLQKSYDNSIAELHWKPRG